jgi:hypothetical protein
LKNRHPGDFSPRDFLARKATANQSANSISPLCGDGRDQIVAQYGQYRVGDDYFPPVPGTNPAQYPQFTPNCFEFAIPPSDPGTIYNASSRANRSMAGTLMASTR